MIDIYSKHDSMHKNGIFYVLIYINNRIILCVNYTLSMDDCVLVMTYKSLTLGSLKRHLLNTT